MSKPIPMYFDSVIIDSPFQGISDSNPNIGRLRVRVFTKYGNRNGSYITEAVAQQLIDSATNGNTPVVGFFDKATETWASHSGPTLANGYGYVEDFLGWEPFTDTDGVTREYAVFSVVLFTNYYEEAKKILGQNQSMELDPASITGEWTLINGEEYYVYTTASMLGFCIIGEHEPCFSVSSFFSKNDDIYKSQYEKFSSLLFDLKAQVEEAKKNNEGGEQPMNEFENQAVVTEVENENQVENPQVQDDTFQAEETGIETEIEQPAVEEFQQEEEPEVNTEEPSEFDALQNQFDELQQSYNTLQAEFDAAQTRIAELEEFQTTANAELESLRTQNQELQTSLQTYENLASQAENTRKEQLVEKYEKVMDEEEITPIKEQMSNFSYEELESKLAISYANKQMAGGEVKKVPLPEPQESQFALLMKKYRKN